MTGYDREVTIFRSLDQIVGTIGQISYIEYFHSMVL